MTGVRRIGPGTARRLIDPRGEDRRVVGARHRAVAPRAVDGDPVDAKPFSATWIG